MSINFGGLLGKMGGAQGLLGLLGGGGIAGIPDRMVGLLQNPLGIQDENDQPMGGVQQMGGMGGFGGLPMPLLMALLQRKRNRRRQQPGIAPSPAGPIAGPPGAV